MKQTAAALKSWLTQAIAATAFYDPAATFVGLATAVVDNQQATTLANVTEVAGAGYARIPITDWSAVYPMQDGRWAVDGPIAPFQLTGVAPAVVASHWFLASLVAGGVLKSWGAIDPPRQLVGGGTIVSVVTRLTVDPDGRWDASVYWNG